jgi:Holliday junction resolvase
MPAKNKTRGTQLEREVVDMCKDLGLEAKRAYASNGQSLGYTDNVDVVVNYALNKLKIQCKRKKKLPDYLVLDRVGIDYDAVVFRQDGKPLKHYVMLELKNFLELIK